MFDILMFDEEIFRYRKYIDDYMSEENKKFRIIGKWNKNYLIWYLYLFMF